MAKFAVVFFLLRTAQLLTMVHISEGRWGGALGGNDNVQATFSNDACYPYKSLYRASGNEKLDSDSVDREAAALSFAIGKTRKGFATASQTAGLAMHSYNLALSKSLNAKLDVALKIKSNTLLKGAKFLATKLGPALGVFGAVFSIIAGHFTPDPAMEAIKQLEKQMNAGFKKLREDMDRKYTELKDFVEESVQFAQVADLEAEMQEMSNYFLSCIDDDRGDDCVRNAIRIIKANKFRYTNLNFLPTNNQTMLIKRKELEIDFLRKFTLVSVLAHITTLMTFDDDERDARALYKAHLSEEIKDFKEVFEKNTRQIIDLWKDKNTYIPLCQRTAVKKGDGWGKVAWSFKVSVNDWNDCVLKGSSGDLNSVERICKLWGDHFEMYARWDVGNKNSRTATGQRAEEYWNQYKKKLFGDDSIYSEIEEKNKADGFNGELLKKIVDEAGKS